MLSTVLAVDRLLFPPKLLGKSVLARDDADFLAKLGSLCGEGVDVKTVSSGLAAGLTQRFDKGLLLLGCYRSVPEEDDTSLRAERKGKSVPILLPDKDEYSH